MNPEKTYLERNIVADYKFGKYTQGEIAKKYGISQSRVSQILAKQKRATFKPFKLPAPRDVMNSKFGFNTSKPITDVKTKMCTLCKEVKKSSEFGWINSYKLRLRPRCRECEKKLLNSKK